MALTFDKIPSVIDIQPEPVTLPTVAQELEAAKGLLHERKLKCRGIKPIYIRPQLHKKKKAPLMYGYKFFCVCPHYNPHYPCKHAGNVIIDRDVLTKEEHICYLSTPRENLAAPRKRPRYYQKKVIIPNCTARIEQLALPDLRRVQYTLEMYKDTLNKEQVETLKGHLEQTNAVRSYNLNTALAYIEEERRLKRVAKAMQKRQCRKLKNHILRKQRRQIRQIICVLFEEMKDFLLNDQFLIDERSTLCAVILEQIKNFTDKEFYTTSNLREYQQVLANNLTVWINKFISNLNIHLAPPQPRIERLEPDAFLPVKDYISCSESGDEEYQTEHTDYFFGEYLEEDHDYLYNQETRTEDTMINTNR